MRLLNVMSYAVYAIFFLIWLFWALSGTGAFGAGPVASAVGAGQVTVTSAGVTAYAEASGTPAGVALPDGPAAAAAKKQAMPDPKTAGTDGLKRPSNPALWERFKKAEAYYYQGKDELALLIFEEIDGQYADNTAMHLYMGDLYLRLEDYDKARRSFRAALSLSKNPGQACLGLGHVMYGLEDGKQSVRYYAAAFQADAKLIQAHWFRGLAHLVLLRDKAKTIADWEMYLKLAGPKDPQRPNILKALAFLKKKDFKLPTLAEMPDKKDFLEFLALGGKVKVPDKTQLPQLSATKEGPAQDNTKQKILDDSGL